MNKLMGGTNDALLLLRLATTFRSLERCRTRSAVPETVSISMKITSISCFFHLQFFKELARSGQFSNGEISACRPIQVRLSKPWRRMHRRSKGWRRILFVWSQG